MDQEFFGERRRALEEEFFKKHNDDLVATMRSRTQEEQLSASLTGATGIDDPVVVSHLLKAGMTSATFMAVALVPLVAVAWADRKLEEPERQRIMRDHLTAELNEDARALLMSWLIEEPESSLFETWIEYVCALRPNLDQAARESLKEATLARARAIAAAAAGEPYGLGRGVSAVEQAVLKRIEAAFAD
jgi:hypothetical protein